jgi:ubiquinol-cytochrome c reductase cytochrome c subunit
VSRLRRWLTHRSRIPRSLRAVLAVVMAALAVVGLAAGPGSAATNGTDTPGAETLPPSQNGQYKPPFGPPPGEPYKTYPSSPQLISEGRSLYRAGCSSCHGFDLRGIKGRAPSLIGVGPGPVDFYLSTGRMPLDNPHQEPVRTAPSYDRHQIYALIAFITKVGGGPPAPATNPSRGSLATGFQVFTERCAGCHQLVARGGLTVGAWVPNLQPATALQVAEAVRMGPYVMPHFDSRQIDQHQLDSLVRYVLWTKHPSNYGGWGIYNIGPIPEGMVTFFVGLAALLIVARLIGERMETE